jgi:hypothetical protein
MHQDGQQQAALAVIVDPGDEYSTLQLCNLLTLFFLMVTQKEFNRVVIFLPKICDI